ncbi:MAG: hypothetical protein M0Z67_11545 [Nitrospiraceae bacterium]|nr:hypothetical protein [Nitrospiraceae bacterium]
MRTLLEKVPGSIQHEVIREVAISEVRGAAAGLKHPLRLLPF